MTITESRTGVVVFISDLSTTFIEMVLTRVMDDRSTSLADRSRNPAMGAPTSSSTVTLVDVLAGKTPSRFRMSHFMFEGRLISSVTKEPL